MFRYIIVFFTIIIAVVIIVDIIAIVIVVVRHTIIYLSYLPIPIFLLAFWLTAIVLFLLISHYLYVVTVKTP